MAINDQELDELCGVPAVVEGLELLHCPFCGNKMYIRAKDHMRAFTVETGPYMGKLYFVGCFISGCAGWALFKNVEEKYLPDVVNRCNTRWAFIPSPTI